MRLVIRIILFVLLIDASALAALSPEQVALVYNRNLPASETLARFYAKARGVPQGNLIGLALPITEEIPFDLYERTVVPPIRDYLQKNGLERQIRCLVTFHGVPFRIGPRVNGAREVGELATLMDERDRTLRQLESSLQGLDAYVAELSPGYQPKAPAADLLSQAMRADAAFGAAQRGLVSTSDPIERERIFTRLMGHMQELSGVGAVMENVAPPAVAGGVSVGEQRTAAHPATTQQTPLARLREDFERAKEQASELYDHRYDPQARSELRKITHEFFGLFGYARLLETQIEYFQTDSTVAALDSELSLLWWNYYPRRHWVPNLLHYDASGKNGAPPGAVMPASKVLMVMRLDGPAGGNVRDLITSSIDAEKKGLYGRIVLDSRGIPPADANGKPDAYGVYDESIRRLGQLIRTRTKLPLTVDDKPEVLPPRSVRDVAIYCGWYSLRNYVPACSFTTGAVGFHIASLEMVSLRGPQEKGWVKGLLQDGIAATMGAVAEPYLHSFPPADDFFPLLLTGQLPLAEVYWRTCPLASWMICMIGDPLYTPYKNRPALSRRDLPEKLQTALDEPYPPAATQGGPISATQGQKANGR